MTFLNISKCFSVPLFWSSLILIVFFVMSVSSSLFMVSFKSIQILKSFLLIIWFPFKMISHIIEHRLTCCNNFLLWLNFMRYRYYLFQAVLLFIMFWFIVISIPLSIVSIVIFEIYSSFIFILSIYLVTIVSFIVSILLAIHLLVYFLLISSCHIVRTLFHLCLHLVILGMIWCSWIFEWFVML